MCQHKMDQPELKALQSGHGMQDQWTDGVKPIYPPTTSLFGGGGGGGGDNNMDFNMEIS